MSESLRDLIDRVNRMGMEGKRVKKSALKKSAEVIKSEMVKNVPRSTKNKAHLADNLKISSIEKYNGEDTIKIKAGNKFYYWKFTEYGTTKIPAQHWARKSVLKSRREVKELVLSELRRGLNL